MIRYLTWFDITNLHSWIKEENIIITKLEKYNTLYDAPNVKQQNPNT